MVGHAKQWGPGTDPKSAIEVQFYCAFMQLPEKLIPLVADVVAVGAAHAGRPCCCRNGPRAPHAIDMQMPNLALNTQTASAGGATADLCSNVTVAAPKVDKS